MSRPPDPHEVSLGDPLPESPLPLFGEWLQLALMKSQQLNPDACCLSTVDAAGKPSGRMVLARGVDLKQGCLVFYSNLESRKSRELEARPHGALTYHWDLLHRQIRVEGPVTSSPAPESDAYWAKRDRFSQLSAWSSDQSRPVGSREEMLARLEEAAQRFGGLEEGDPVPRPPHWGGTRLWVQNLELWLGAMGRLHDRAVWRRELVRHGEGYQGGAWTGTRLQP